MLIETDEEYSLRTNLLKDVEIGKLTKALKDIVVIIHSAWDIEPELLIELGLEPIFDIYEKAIKS